MDIVIGITGATGAVYGIRLLEVLRDAGVDTHLVLSRSGALTLQLETSWTVEEVKGLAAVVHPIGDIGATVASGSFRHDGMIVAPCSMKTLSGIVHSYSDTLVVRAADVTLKERRPLVLVVRETPLHVGHLRLMTQAAEMGAVVFPPVPAFYGRPTTIEQLVDVTVVRILDQLGFALPAPRWEGTRARLQGAPALPDEEEE